MRTTLIVPVFVALVCAAAHAQTPPRRAHHALVYDEANARVLLSGGSTPLDGGNRFEFYNDLWAYDGGWKLITTAHDRRSGQRLAYDSENRKIYSFGGFSGAASLSDLRRLDGDAWTALPSPDRPTAEPGFVYDAKRKRLVVFGGSAGMRRVHGDTWEFDGERWTQTGTAGPPARQAHAMAYDAKRGRTVLFGGMSAEGAAFGDTWEYDGAAWKLVASEGPSARNTPGMTYDAKRGRIILFGGAAEAGFSNETWAWDGAEWKLLAREGPPARGMGQLAYDAKRDVVVLFGGRNGWPNGDLDDTWEFDGVSWRAVK
jgi:hypothetical protein